MVHTSLDHFQRFIQVQFEVICMCRTSRGIRQDTHEPMYTSPLWLGSTACVQATWSPSHAVTCTRRFSALPRTSSRRRPRKALRVRGHVRRGRPGALAAIMTLPPRPLQRCPRLSEPTREKGWMQGVREIVDAPPSSPTFKLDRPRMSGVCFCPDTVLIGGR